MTDLVDDEKRSDNDGEFLKGASISRREVQPSVEEAGELCLGLRSSLTLVCLVDSNLIRGSSRRGGGEVGGRNSGGCKMVVVVVPERVITVVVAVVTVGAGVHCSITSSIISCTFLRRLDGNLSEESKHLYLTFSFRSFFCN